MHFTMAVSIVIMPSFHCAAFCAIVFSAITGYLHRYFSSELFVVALNQQKTIAHTASNAKSYECALICCGIHQTISTVPHAAGLFIALLVLTPSVVT